MDSDVNPYELLDIATSATDQEIKSAYRKKSLTVHPDRNPNNPEAASKFHELNQAYELILDPLRRLALDAKLRTAQAKKDKFKNYDKKRKEMVEELEEREREFKRQRMEKGMAMNRAKQDEDKIKEAGRRMREQKEKEKMEKEKEAEEEDEEQVPELGPLDTTIRLKYSSSSSAPTTTESLASLFSQFGELDPSLIVLKQKKKSITALISFKQLLYAFAAVNSSNQASKGLQGIQVSWATGKEEPPLLKWLNKMGKLTTTPAETEPEFENLTLLRLRQAERERIEKEILEAEANEE